MITGEQVEAAARAIFESRGSSKWDDVSDMWAGARATTRKEARAALEAAAPYLLAEAKAEALEAAADAREVDSVTGVELFALGIQHRQWLRARAATYRVSK